MLKQISSTVEEQRRRANFTVVIKKERPWEIHEMGTLANELFTNVRSDPQYPMALIIDGKLEKGVLVELLNLACDAFDHQVVVGIKNPALPFNIAVSK